MANVDDRPTFRELAVPAAPQFNHQWLNDLYNQVHSAGGSCSISQDHDAIQIGMRFNRFEMVNQTWTTDNTNNPHPGWIPQVPFPSQPKPGDPITFQWPNPNVMPEELKKELMAMRLDGEDVEAVIRRLMAFAEQIRDLLDQARTNGMNV